MVDFVRGSNPVWFMVDLVAEPFDDTFYMWVLENEIPYIPAQVYHTPTGVVWNSPIQFLANGTLPIDIFFDPDKVYRLEFRHNLGLLPPSQSDPLIYLVEDYQVGASGDQPIDLSGVFTDNQVTNPQFSLISFESPYILTGVTDPDPIQIAPGWELVLAGTGNVELEQVPLNSSTSNPSNAPYALRIELSGAWTSQPYIRQRFSQNGMLWANKYVSFSVTGRIEGSQQAIVAKLESSTGMPLAILMSELLTNDFEVYQGFALLPDTVNTDTPPNAYIDLKILLPYSAELYLTSFQVISSGVPSNVTYEQDTIDRQIDQTFHYYKPQLEYKPIPSYLVGWDFPMNPAQFGVNVGIQTTGNNGSFYAWDQTIVFQSIDEGVTVARGTSGGLELTAAQTGQMAIVQYLGQIEARELLSGNIAVSLKAFSTVAQTVTVSLWATTDGNVPTITTPDFDSIVASLGTNGSVATRNGSWTQLARANPGNLEITLSAEEQEFYLNGWFDNPAAPLADTATHFAIVIGTNEVTAANKVTFDWVGLMAGDIATRPAPKSFQDTLRECEFYYEKSYANGSYAGDMTSINSLNRALITEVPHGGPPTVSGAMGTAFDIEYKTIKRDIPNVYLYSDVTGTVDVVRAWNRSSTSTNTDVTVATYFATQTIGTKCVSYSPTTDTAFASVQTTQTYVPGQAWISFQYVLDARFGVV